MKANKGAPGIDGITVDEIGAYLRDNQEVTIEKIYKGKYTPDPVRRKEIPKADSGMRKLGIPTVKNRHFSTSHCTTTDANLRNTVRGWKLRLPPGKKRKRTKNTKGV